MKEPSESEIKQSAIGLLARREHSQKELRHKLKARFADETLIERVLVSLAENKLQSDERFCEAYIQSRVSRGFGPVRIRMELNERDVSSEIVEGLFDELDFDWSALAEKVRAKKFGGTLPSDFSEKAKQLKFLEYRGFKVTK